MKIVFIGCVLFSKKMLETLIDIKADIAGVVTKSESKFNSDFCDLSALCTENNIPYHYTKDVNSQETIDWIKLLNPDIIFCFGWSSLIKKELLNLTPMGVIGYHPAQLPQNRGRHPLIWALALGLKKSASTFFFMDEGADTGDILSQDVFTISEKDNAQTLMTKLEKIAAKQVKKFHKELKSGRYKRIKQDNSNTNNWRKRNYEDGLIRFSMNSDTIYNLTRALYKPYVGASYIYNGNEVKIWKVKKLKNNRKNLEYGKVLNVTNNNNIIVKTPDGAIEIVEHEFNPLPKIGEYL